MTGLAFEYATETGAENETDEREGAQTSSHLIAPCVSKEHGKSGDGKDAEINVASRLSVSLAYSYGCGLCA